MKRYKGKNYRIRDNGGKTIDRYCLITSNKDVYFFNECPYHPQGVGMYSGQFYGSDTRYLGKLISLNDLPEQAQKFVKERLI